MGNIGYRAPWMDIEGNVKYINIELKAEEDLNVIWRTHHPRQTKGPVKFDATIAISIDNIIKMLRYLKSSSSV